MLKTAGSQMQMIDSESYRILSCEDNGPKSNFEIQHFPKSYSSHSRDSDGSNTSHFNLDMLTIEGLRKYYHSCSSCGVSWLADHITLDCDQCDGYAMYRPCITCNGQCDSLWKRDIFASHQNRKACWIGSCNIIEQFHSIRTTQETVLQRKAGATENAL